MRKGLVGASVVGLVAAGGAGDARACGFLSYGGDEPPKVIVIPPPERVASAERELERGLPFAAARDVGLAFPKVRGLAGSAVPLEARAVRIVALAVARTDGAPGIVGFDGSSARARGENLSWAAGVLRKRLATRPDDPVAQADLAEALERAPGGRDEALATLRRLAARDLLGSPFAYASLARMELAAGDARAAHESALRCRAMTKSPDAVCPSVAGQALASR